MFSPREIVNFGKGIEIPGQIANICIKGITSIDGKGYTDLTLGKVFELDGVREIVLVRYGNDFFGDPLELLQEKSVGALCNDFAVIWMDHQRIQEWPQHEKITLATMFHFPNWKPKPKEFQDEVYINHILESPANYEQSSETMPLFDFEWNYKIDSVLYGPYIFQEHAHNWFEDPKVKFEYKSHLSLFVQSNCNSKSNREFIISSLMDHMEIHSRGGCLPNYERVGDLADLLEKSQGYKFVFAIENSLCTEYVTEKLTHPMKCGAIPIIYSETIDGIKYPDYDVFFPSDDTHKPSDGYINLADFASAKEAAEFINKVGSDEELYNSYMWYRFLSQSEEEKVRKELLSRRQFTRLTVEENLPGFLCEMAEAVKKFAPMKGKENEIAQPNIWK